MNQFLVSGRLLVWYLVLLSLLQLSSSQCTSTSGPGTCSGPVQRTEVTRGAIPASNNNCGINQVSYVVDNNVGAVACGTCIPGYGGWDDPSHSCELDEYCTDSATCSKLTSSPFWKQPCPFESGTSPSWCGPGLRCYQHTCVPCLDGMMDYSDGKMCVNSQWTYSKWKAIGYSPNDSMSLLIFIFLIMAVIAPFFAKFWVAYGHPKFNQWIKKFNCCSSKRHSSSCSQSMTKPSDSQENHEKSDSK